MISRSGMLLASLVMSIITALLLTLAWTHLDQLTQSSDATTALLLAIPAIFTGYLLRPDEHPLVTKLFKGLRGLVFVSGFCALVAAALVVVGVSLSSLERIWPPLMCISWISALALGGSMFGPRRRRQRVCSSSAEHKPGSPQGLPPAGVHQAVAASASSSDLQLDGFPVESAEGWRSGFVGMDSEQGIAETLALALRMRQDGSAEDKEQ